MKYMGSKNRIAKDILPIMLKDRFGKPWIEPFVGGGNMIDKVDGVRIGYDLNPFVIQALIAIRDNIVDLPKNNSEFNETDYSYLRTHDYRFKGYAGFAFSYGGKWLGGWSRESLGKRDYVKEAYDNAFKQSPKLQGVELHCSSYKDIILKERSIIYCDPPYSGTTKYSNSSFDHFEFWGWCRQKSREGHTVFISEYSAPDDFECLYEKKIVNSLTRDTGSKVGTEKLFRWRGR